MSTPARKRLVRDSRRLLQDPPAGISGAPLTTTSCSGTLSSSAQMIRLGMELNRTYRTNGVPSMYLFLCRQSRCYHVGYEGNILFFLFVCEERHC
ncbi:unnamed protein product [Brassica rapa]|uniref:Uncharacterized protein n=2 Tax=Brassica TaxID=3705 RepID=A0A8D9DEN3_BRACM|nr:unnamed protein product [Brassica napus]CAF2355221.1 unnamed protein product [Brassica napus]CAG7874084.1 unnamed protein product [Brassica rapa]